MTNFGEPYINSFTFKRIGSLEPNPPPLIRLAWKTSRAVSASINQDIGEVTPVEAGYLDVLMTTPQISYTLTATNEFGSTTRTLWTTTLPAPQVPVSVTSTPYNVYIEEGLFTSGELTAMRIQFVPELTESIFGQSILDDGQLRNVVQEYTIDPEGVYPESVMIAGQFRNIVQVYDIPYESYTALTTLIGGELKTMLVEYDIPYESYTALTTLTGGESREIVKVYSYWPNDGLDNLNMYSDLTSGSLA